VLKGLPYLDVVIMDRINWLQLMISIIYIEKEKEGVHQAQI
jgi:hypothetical protein